MANKISRKVKELERDTWNYEHYKKQDEFISSKRKTYKGMNNYEKKLWKKIRLMIQEDIDSYKDDPNNRARGRLKLEWFDRLGVKYDVLFIRAKKNTGKTYQLSRMVTDFLKDDPQSKFIYMRNTVGELEAVEDQMANDPNWPIYKKANRLYLKKRKGMKMATKPVGRCIALTGESAKCAQGASNRDDLRAVIYDEANFTKSSHGVKMEDLSKLPVLFSSLVRDKKDVKIYMFGNTLRNEDGSISDIFLDSLGVIHGVPLKLFNLPTPDGSDFTRLLYVDFGSELRGIESQKFINIFGSVNDLLTNDPKLGSRKIIGYNFFLDAEPFFAFLFLFANTEKIMYVGQLLNAETNETHLVVKIENYDHDKTYKYQPFTNELTLFTKYFPRMKLPEKENISQIFAYFSSFFYNNRLWFVDEETSLGLAVYMKHWTEIFDLDYELSKWA